MKFLPTALVGLFSVSAQASTPTKLINRRMSSKKLNKKKLMRNAVPYNKERRLGGEDFEPSSDYSIQFSQCVSLRTADEDLFDDLYEYTYSGKVIGQKSYVLFNLCETENECAYHDDANLYMTPLGDYMDAVVEYNKQTLERKCEACEQTCNQEYEEDEAEEEEADEEEADEEEGEEDEDGEDRRLKRKLGKSTKRKLYNYIDCDECANLNCEEDEEEEGDDDGDQAKNAYEWLENMAECAETGAAFETGDELFAGFICNSAGDGVEIALFLDEECSIYTNTKGYGSIMSDADSQFLYESKDIVINAFKEDISCENIEYDNPEEADDYEEEEENDEEDEVNEFCKKVFDEDTKSLNDCGYDDEEEEEEDEYEEDENQVNYDWYEYDLSDEDAENAYKVCVTMQAFEGEYTSVYVDDEEASGSLFDYHATETSSSSGGGAGKVFGIIILVLVVAVVIYFVAQAMGKKKDSKAEPLTKSEGAMA